MNTYIFPGPSIIINLLHIVSGGAKPRQTKLGASQWWIACLDHCWGYREQSKVENWKSSRWSQKVVNSGKCDKNISEILSCTR